ncbi:Aste57867_16678 [Aphanomyces stellatus]|uniref:Aste57867_16678 protein n=1 Tax=Aphanomyces stellatus TaxID=120398 RepID=A0A485L669_9STRA|nr:hypothetical protein As57867_016621 [Aphanomyces stellatus]VFT93449.1 Aste57867_16678 [Aphanomyces stellatus]
MTTRIAQTGLKKWFSDPATYPIIAIMAVAGGMGIFGGFRYVTQSPDVSFSKEKRKSMMSHSAEEAEAFRAHRVTAATLKPNPITREAQYQAFKARAQNS